MKFSATAAILALATAVTAAPGGYHHPPGRGVTAEQFVNQCGRANIECCNDQKKINKVSNANDGLLGALNNLGLDSLTVFGQCSKLNIPIDVIGVGLSELLSSQCNNKVACCGNNGNNWNGLVNVEAGCAVPNLL